MNYKEEMYLRHFGVKGMRWGVRKTETSSGGDDKKKKGLTPKQKTAIKIGVAVAATSLAAYGGYRLYKSGKLDTFINSAKSSFDPETGFKKIKGSDIGISKINKINLFDRGTWMNCGNSTIALELRNRGLDVKANKNPTGMYFEQLAQYFKLGDGAAQNIHVDENYVSPKAIRSFAESQILKAFPDGARGSVALPMNTGNHFFGFAIEKGKVIFKDAQNPRVDPGTLFANLDTTRNVMGRKLNGFQVVRLDNAKVNVDKIREVVSPRNSSLAFDKTIKSFELSKMHGEGFVIPDFDYPVSTKHLRGRIG